MDITIQDKKNRELCEQKVVAQRKLGDRSAQKLRVRLADLRAAPTLADFPPLRGRLHPLKADRKDQFALDLEGGCRLVFEPSHDPIPRKDDGGIDLHSITRIRIVFIGDYHD